MNPPFKLIVETDIEKFRLDTWDTKEPETIAWIDAMPDKSVLYDVGANIGLYTLYFAATHPQGKVYAFEPSKTNYKRLVENIVLNQFKNVMPLCFGIGSTPNIGKFYEYDLREGATGGQVSLVPEGSNYQHASMMESYCVIISIDGFVSVKNPDKNVIVDPPNFIKVDIDGQESEVVKGMWQTLDDPMLLSVLIELDPTATNIPHIVKLFKDKKFTINNDFNCMENHSRVRRLRENILCENVIFTRGEDILQ